MGTEFLPASDLAIPPGEYLAEVVEELGLSQADLAARMDRPAQAINEIIAGTKSITAETALQLERVTGVPAHIWTSLEADYRLALARASDDQAIEGQIDLARSFPYRELVRLGLVQSTRLAKERVRELCRFFGVASLPQVSRVADYAPAFRVSRGDASPYALAAWLRLVSLRAQTISTRSFQRNQLVDVLGTLRGLTSEAPADFLPTMQALLAECGVAFVVCPHLPRTYVQGATFWVTPEKAVVATTIRGRWADVFWFSVFHELGHLVLRHSKREVFLEDGRLTTPHPDLESDANDFARDLLLPPKDFGNFSKRGNFAPDAIKEFSRQVGIAPGIVVGRLQHEGYLPRSHNILRIRYQWVESTSTHDD